MSPKLRPLIPLGLFLGSLSVGYIALAWTAPTTTPPGNNVSAPINVSNTAQNKAGNLYIGSSSGSSAFPLRVVGNGIDTSTLYVDAGSVFAGNPSVSQWDSQYYSTDTAGSNTARHDIGGAHGWDQNMLYINGWNDWTSGVSVGGPGGSSNLTVTGSLCLNGSCKSDWSQVTGNQLWQQNGSSIYYNAGNVGVGTAGPTQKLDINGNLAVNINGPTNGGRDIYMSSDAWMDYWQAGAQYRFWYNGGTLAWVAANDYWLQDMGNWASGAFLSSSTNGVQTKTGNLAITGTLTVGGQQITGVPSGAVMFFNLTSCPSGWSAVANAQGRYLVGLQPGGSLASTDGIALSNLEDRPTGQATVNIHDPGHSHTIPGQNYPRGYPGYVQTGENNPCCQSGNVTTSTSTTGITADVGSVAGTNAPYIQFLVCQKQ